MKRHSKEQESQPQYPETSLPNFREDIRAEFENQVRLQALKLIQQIFEEEVKELCGKSGRHKKKEDLAHRGGSEEGWVMLRGQRTRIKRPRARKDGKEIGLTSYKGLQQMDYLDEVIKDYMIHGVSTRSYDKLLEKFSKDLGLSKSTVSRLFTKKSRESLNNLNSRSFEGHTFWSLMVDGIEFGGSVLLVILGVDTDGVKHILGLSEGSSENHEICKELLAKIFEPERKIHFTDKLLAVIDGSRALKKGLSEYFGERVKIQRCTEHKKRNIKAKLNKKYHSEFSRKYKVLVNTVSFDDAEAEMDSLYSWLKDRNFEAARSLEEARDELLTLHKLGMPSALRTSFITTNLIESAFSSPRNKMGRVKFWRKNTDQLQRWAAVTFLEQEKSFRRLKGYKEINNFLVDFSQEYKNKVSKQDIA